MSKKAFYSSDTKRLVAYGSIENFPDAVGVEVADDFAAPLYVTQWNGKAFVSAPIPSDFTVASPDDLASNA